MTQPAPNPSRVQALPPPAPDAVSSPGPTSWAAPLPPPTVAAAIAPHVADAVARREVGHAFELIWPTGEVDEELLGPFSEDAPDGAPVGDSAPASMTSPPSEPITVLLRPVIPPSEVPGPGSEGPVPDDVVRAVQRAIAAIGSEETMVDEQSPAPRLPDPSTGSAAGGPAPSAIAGGPPTMRPPSGPTDARRSALKRLINGLRRR